MTEVKARQIVLAARPQGRPKPSDFRLEETEIPTPSAGQVLLRVEYLSLDPYMRSRMDDRKSYATPVPLGGVMQGESVATVIASKHPGYSEGDIVLAQTGWRTHALSDRADLRKLDPAVAPVTTGLGVLGMPGFTAYGGLRMIGPRAGKRWWSRRRVDRSGRWSASSRKSAARERSALLAGQRSALM
jgi:NADPH-dependent curcumin reductase